MAALMDGSISAVEEKPTVPAKSKDILRLLGSSTTTPNYPDETPRHFHAGLKILNTPDAKGRGVFATENMSRGTLLEISPVLVVPPEQYSIPGQAAVSQSVLKDYVFVWNRKGAMALALGLGSIFNHAKFPNVSFTIDRTTQTIQYTLCKDVAAGEELCIYYGPHARYGELDDSEEEETLDGWEAISAVTLGSEEDSIEREKKAIEQIQAEESLDPQEEILFKDLPCQRVTNEICLADIPLETADAWVIDIESKHAPIIFEVLKDAQIPTTPMQHLKRIKRLTAKTMSVLVHPTSPPIPDSLLLTLQAHPCVLVQPYRTPVPIRPAVTREQILEFAVAWPTIFVPIRVGRSAEILSKGWKREHLDWVRTMLARVERLANEAVSAGELPIASLVASSVLGPPLAEAIDKRTSTGNLLCHSVSHVIDAVAAIDRRNGRLVEGQPPPYLLSGLSLFTTHEPCLMCSMSLLHSRIAVVYYLRKSPHAGGLGSVYQVHEDKGLNHKFQAWHWTAEGLAEGRCLEVDP